tara:strand:- start:15629 stop:16237 length:609 start_codon:yes stop_codon:yes gene_type:complete
MLCSKEQLSNYFRISICIFTFFSITACSTRDVQSELNGSSAQRLISHSIDDLVSKLDDTHLNDLKNQKVYINSYFIDNSHFKDYADQRLALELQARFGATIVATQAESNQVMTVFYTSLATDFDSFGISIPFGYVPGVDESTRLNILTLEKFHGVSEMYYYLGPTGTENRSKVIQAKVKTDALGLPFITIPLSTVDRHDSWF